MVDINPINPQSVTVNVPSNGSLTVNNTDGSTAQVSTNADAQLAYSWACGVGLIQGIDYSAKYWAGKAKESELIAVNAIQDIEDAKDDAIAELESAKDTCLNNIELAGDDKVAEIEGLASDYESILITLTNRAETAADNAETSKTNAANSASNAAASATSASTSASNANSSASSAAESANLASNSKEDARSYANSARQDMTKAQTAAGQANDSARSASQSETVTIQAQATAVIARDAAQGYAQQAEQAKEDIEAELGNYVSTSSLTTILTDYVLSSDLSTTLADYVTSSALTTTLTDYATQQWAQQQASSLYASMQTWVQNQGYTTNVGTVTSVNNTQPDANGNVTIQTGGTVDQTFDGTSQNAQSGVAIAGKLADYVLSDSSNSIDISSGTSIGFNAPETTDITANGLPIITSYNILSNDAYLTIGEYSNNYGIYLYDSDYVRFFYAEDGSSGLSAYSSNRQSHYAIDLLPSGISFGNEDYTTTITVPSDGLLALNGHNIITDNNLKTINNQSIIGSGNITISGGGAPSNMVTTDTAQDVSGRKTFLGEKAIYFKQQATSNKLGFTLYNPSNTELGALEYRPNTISGASLLALNCPQTMGGYVGFRYWGTPAVNIVAPKVATAGNYYIPTHITNGSTTVTANNQGTVNISSLLPDVSNYVTNSSLATTLSSYATQAWVGQQGYITDVINALGFTPASRDLENITSLGTLISGEFDNVYTALGSKADTDLSNLSTTSQAIIDGKADTTLSNVSSIDSSSAVATALDDKADADLSNLSATGQAVIDAKVNNDDYYYKSGDTVSNLEYFTGGLLTSGGTEIDFCIYLPKSMAKITTVTCTALSTGFRKSNGGYMPSNGWNALANGRVTLFKYSDNMLRVQVTYSNYGGTNNTPVGVYASISLSFT
jgi:hypothetical protein